MHTISSISEFLLEARTEYRIFDMGRTIRQIEAQMFLDIENGLLACPFPRQQMFWCGILFWNKALSEQQYIWFLKLPLDERGCVVTAHRDQFLHIILDALGKEFIEEHKDAKLPDNPYQFNPPQQQMADFNAMAKQCLDLPMSADADAALQYLLDPAKESWELLSLQGIADRCTTLEKDLSNALSLHWKVYPKEVIRPICAALENQRLPETLRANLTAYLYQIDIASEDAILLLRAISKDNQDKQLQSYLTDHLSSETILPLELLIVLAGRYWYWCQSERFVLPLLEACARSNCFDALYPDLVQIPSIRDNLLAVLRSTKRSDKLAKAIGELFQR